MSPNWLHHCLNFQFNGIAVLSSGGSLPPFRSKISRPAEHRIIGTENKPFASGSLGVTIWGTTHFYLWEKQHQILDAESQHIHSTGESCLSPAMCCHQAGTVTEFPKGHSTVCQSSCFSMVGNMVRSVSSMSVSYCHNSFSVK